MRTLTIKPTKKSAEKFIKNKGLESAVIIEKLTDRSDPRYTRKSYFVTVNRDEYFKHKYN